MTDDIKALFQSKGFFVFLSLMFKLFLDLSYSYAISPLFSYMGLVNNLNIYKLIESYALVVIMCYTIRHKVERVSDFYLMLFYVLIIIPCLNIYPYKDFSRLYMYMLIASFYTMQIFANSPKLRLSFSDKKINENFIVYAFALVGILMFTWIIMRGGLKYLNFDFRKVYDTRREIAEVIFPGPFAYFMNWYGKIINPTLLVFCLWDRKKLGTVITLICQVFFFGFTSHKSMLFYPVLVIFIAIVKGNKYTGNLMTMGLAGLTFLCLAFYLITDNWQPISVIVRRVFMVTADNHFRYYDAFKNIDFVYLTDKSWVFGGRLYPYNYPIQALISMIYYGHPNTWVNTGFIANGYANFGFYGMLTYSAVTGWLIGIMDEISYKKMPLWVAIAITIVPVFNLISVDLLTGLLYHGLIMSIILMWLLSKRDKKVKEI